MSLTVSKIDLRVTETVGHQLLPSASAKDLDNLTREGSGSANLKQLMLRELRPLCIFWSNALYSS